MVTGSQFCRARGRMALDQYGLMVGATSLHYNTCNWSHNIQVGTRTPDWCNQCIVQDMVLQTATPDTLHTYGRLESDGAVADDAGKGKASLPKFPSYHSSCVVSRGLRLLLEMLCPQGALETTCCRCLRKGS